MGTVLHCWWSVDWYSHYGEQYGGSVKTKNSHHTVVNSTPRRICGGKYNLKNTCNPMFIAAVFIKAKTWKWKWKWSRSVVSDSLWPHGLQPVRLLCPWDFPGKNTGMGCHFLLQGIFPTQGLNLGLPHCRQMLLPSEPPGKFMCDKREYNLYMGREHIGLMFTGV